jgi:metallophosphoesterase (TIGR03767 family)
MHPLDRRAFLRNLGLATAAAWAGPELLGRYSQAIAWTLGQASFPGGTTLEATIVPGAGPGYVRLGDGPGWPTVVRTLTGQAQAGREDRRVALASIVHLTDIHIVDAQSTTRVEFLDRYADPPSQSIPFNAAQRPQETLTAQVSEAMVQRVNSLPGGPITGRAFDCAVSTGDNVDNCQRNELAWSIGVLDGGAPVTPNSGDPDNYEGVQDENALTYDQHYWHPENPDPDSDFYKHFHGFPAYPGLLAAAIKGFTPTGLKMPWYTVFGNHDGLLSGNAPGNEVFNAIATGPLKVVDLPAGMSPGDFSNGISQQDPAVLAALATAPARPVTADPNRAIVSAQDWVQGHLDSPGSPSGHGFTAANKDSATLYYAFTIAPGVTGLTLDTVNRGGYADGSIGSVQQAWLKARLDEAKAAGNLVVLFSHHNLATLNNPVPDPPTIAGADPQRVMGPAIEALLHQYANVVLWVNGHSHVNRITPHPDPSGATQGFWEVSTAAHIDYPQHARLVELVNNRDGSLSIFCTLIEHAAGAATSVGATDVLGLAAISRELSANDFQVDLAAALGTANDRNVELVLAAPAVSSLAPSVTSGSAGAGAAAGDGAGRGDLAATGWSTSAPLAVGAALVGGALALRNRERHVDRHVDTASEQA